MKVGNSRAKLGKSGEERSKDGEKRDKMGDRGVTAVRRRGESRGNQGKEV